MHEDRIKELSAAVHADLAGPESIPVELRAGKGLDRAKVNRVTKALEELQGLLHGNDMVPTLLADALLDVTAAFEQNRGAYAADVQDAIENAAHAITELASGIFGE